MGTRYFVRCLAAVGIHRAGHEICLEEKEFAAVRRKGLVQLQYKELDGKRVEVDDDEGASLSTAPPAPAKPETFPLDTLTSDEQKIILDRRAKAEKTKADDDAKAKADGEKAAKAEAEKRAKAEAKRVDDDAKAKANDKK